MNCDDNVDIGKSIFLFLFLLVLLFLPVPHSLKAWERFLSDNLSISLYNLSFQTQQTLVFQ